MYTTGQTAPLFGIDAITLKRWVEAYPEFFSKEAQPGKGKTRIFNDEDLEVLAFIFEKRKQLSESEIKTLLKRGDRGIPPTGKELAIVTTHEMNKALTTMQEHVKELEKEIQYERKRADKAEGKVELLLEQLKEKEAEIDRLKHGHD